jgi:diguanylate cyclase (GGDEF)-like protein
LLFWGIQGLAFLSVLIPSGPTRPVWYYAALGFTAAVAAVRAATPWAKVPQGFQVTPLLLATAGIGCLIFSAGKSTGLGSLLLLPLLFSAFYGQPWESYVVIPGIAVAEGLLGFANHSTWIVLVRVLVFWVSLLVMISLAAHGLRRRLQATVAAAEEEARQSAVVADATRALSAPLDPELVIRTATRLAAELVSSSTQQARRGQYFEVGPRNCTVVSESDETGMTSGEMVVPIAQHPSLRMVLETGEPMNGPVDRDQSGPEVRANLERFGITHGAYVPIRLNGEITGILNASGRGAAIHPGLFGRLLLLGSITELALTNASTLQQLEAQALSDPLTELANRRELERAFRRLPDRMPFAFVAIDLDGLKGINDRWGHAAGDEVIVAVAAAIASVSRRGDTVARVGGDEFSVLMLDATLDAVERLAGRIHEATQRVMTTSGTPRVSIGACVADGGSDTGMVQAKADAALYQAKRGGGSRTVTRVFELVDLALIA